MLWDLVAWIDEETVEFIREKGGLKAIVISHPHFWTTHLEWVEQFGCPVYLQEADAEWCVISSFYPITSHTPYLSSNRLQRPDPHPLRKFISGTTTILPGVTSLQAGGHFPGSSFLCWDRKLFIADTMMSVPSGFYHKDRQPGTVSFSFMWAYPNMIPLSPEAIMGIWRSIRGWEFEATFGGFMGQDVRRGDLKAQVLESAKIFLRRGGHKDCEIFGETA